jgi:single stranded DNA-binding protein
MSLNSTRGIQLYQCMNLNKVLLAGRLTREVELHYTPKATPVVEIGVAINRFFTSNDGQKKEETTFVDVTLWSRQAEIAQRYLHKGSPVFIEGRLQLDTWEDKQSCQKRFRLRVVGENMQLLGSKEGAAATPREPVPGQTRVPQASTTIPSGRGAGVPDPDLDAKPRLGKPAFASSAEPGKPATPTETRAAGFLAILTSSLLSDELKATHQTDDRDHARTGSRRRRRARTLRYSPHYFALPLRAFAYEAF